MLIFTIKGIKKIVIYTTYYIKVVVQTVLHKQTCMLIYGNQYDVEKINFLKTN